MGKVVTFFGGDSKTGTSMIAMSVTEALKDRKKTILLLQCAGKRENVKEEKGIKNIDDIKANILSGKITVEDVEEIISRKKGYHLILGVKNPYGARFYPENTAKLICDAISDKYEYVIIDGGGDVNSGLGISALTAADKIFFVLDQGRKTIERFTYMNEQVLRPLGIKGEFIINKYVKEPSLYRKNEMEKIFNAGSSFTVPYIEYGLQMEMEDKTLMKFARFQKKVNKITDDIEGVNNKKLWKKNFL